MIDLFVDPGDNAVLEDCSQEIEGLTQSEIISLVAAKFPGKSLAWAEEKGKWLFEMSQNYEVNEWEG